MRRAALALPALLSGLAALSLTGGQLYLDLKARLAAALLDRALAATLADGQPHAPWPGADLAPIARLELPGLSVERTVLSGAGGGSLAFGVGHLPGSAAPGEPGRCVLAGHRDGVFRCLAELAPGDAVTLAAHGGERRYVVTGRTVVDDTETWVADPLLGDGLTLVTCWPFGALRRGPKRYVVFCEPGQEEAAPSRGKGRLPRSADDIRRYQR